MKRAAAKIVLKLLNFKHFPKKVIWRTLYNWFKEGRADVNDDARPGRPSTLTTNENIIVMKNIILDNRRITIREVSDDVGV